MPASPRPARRRGSSHLGAAAAPSAVAVRASLRAVSPRRPARLPEGPRPRRSWAREKVCPAVPGGARRTAARKGRGSPGRSDAGPRGRQQRAPRPREGDPAQAKVGQVLTARPSGGPWTRGPGRRLRAGVGPRSGTRPGRRAWGRSNGRVAPNGRGTWPATTPQD